MNGNSEIEWEFDVSDLEAVRAWLEGNVPRFGLALAAPERAAHTDTYLDTPDWRFHRAGQALRVRRYGGTAEATFKTFGMVQDGARHRHEITEPIKAPARLPFAALPARLAALPGPVGQRLRAVTAGALVQRLFESRVDRETMLARRDDRDAAEIAFDTVRVLGDPKGAPLILLRLEVEARGGDTAGLNAFVDALRDECALKPADASKFELGLKMGGLHPVFAPYLGAPATEAELIQLTGGAPTIGLLAFTVMRERFAQFAANEPGARMGDDPEFVHDMRVATRRLRAAMGLFQPFLPRRAQALRDELRWVAGALGAVRDLDVQLEHLAHAVPAEPDSPETAAAYADISRVLRAQRDGARTALLGALNSQRYAELVGGFEELLRAGPHKADVVNRKARRILPSLIVDRYRKVRRGGDPLGEASPAAEYHALRIRVKRLRYALEFSRPVFGPAVDAFIPGVLAVQDILGGYQDAMVAIAHMRALSLSEEAFIAPHMVFALGEMSQQRASQAEALRAQFPEAYERIRGREWRRLRKALA